MNYYTLGRAQSSNLNLCQHKRVDVLLHVITYLHELYIAMSTGKCAKSTITDLVSLPGSQVDTLSLGEGGFKRIHK